MSKKFSQKPSSLLWLADPYVAYCIDEACYMWGHYVDYELDVAARDPKELNKKEIKSATARRTRTFERLMEGEQAESRPVSVSRTQFRDPATMFSKKPDRKVG
jgi:hypothetical protein